MIMIISNITGIGAISTEMPASNSDAAREPGPNALSTIVGRLSLGSILYAFNCPTMTWYSGASNCANKRTNT